MREEGERYSLLLRQTDMGILHFDNKIEGPTILVCMELERFLSWFLRGSTLKWKWERRKKRTS